MKSLFLLIILFLSSCGDSPFLNDKANIRNAGEYQAIEEEIVFPQSKIAVRTYWRSGPLIGDESKMMALLFDENGTPLDQEVDLRVMLWMPTMGHGSFPVNVEPISVGIYEVSDVFFTMPGLWDIHFQTYKNNELVEEVKWDIYL